MYCIFTGVFIKFSNKISSVFFIRHSPLWNYSAIQILSLHILYVWSCLHIFLYIQTGNFLKNKIFIYSEFWMQMWYWNVGVVRVGVESQPQTEWYLGITITYGNIRITYPAKFAYFMITNVSFFSPLHSISRKLSYNSDALHIHSQIYLKEKNSIAPLGVATDVKIMFILGIVHQSIFFPLWIKNIQRLEPWQCSRKCRTEIIIIRKWNIYLILYPKTDPFTTVRIKFRIVRI